MQVQGTGLESAIKRRGIPISSLSLIVLSQRRPTTRFNSLADGDEMEQNEMEWKRIVQTHEHKLARTSFKLDIEGSKEERGSCAICSAISHSIDGGTGIERGVDESLHFAFDEELNHRDCPRAESQIVLIHCGCLQHDRAGHRAVDDQILRRQVPECARMFLTLDQQLP